MGKKNIAALAGVGIAVVSGLMLWDHSSQQAEKITSPDVQGASQGSPTGYSWKTDNTIHQKKNLTASGEGSGVDKYPAINNAGGSVSVTEASASTTSDVLDSGKSSKLSPYSNSSSSWSQVVSVATRFFDKYGSNHNGQSLYLKPETEEKIIAGDVNEVQRIISHAGKQYFRLKQGDGIAAVNSKVDDLDNVYYTFQQTYEGIPVHGKKLVVRTDRDDRVSLVAGSYESDLKLQIIPSLSGQDALNQALSKLDKPPVGAPVIHAQPELTVYVHDTSGEPKLAYRAVVEYMDASGVNHLDEVFVNAHQAGLIRSFTRIHSAIKREIYSAQGLPCLGSPFVPTSATLPGARSFGEGGSGSADNHEQGAYDHTGSAYWFYYYMYQRDSYNAKGIRLRSTVHAQFMTPQNNCTGMNAQYRPEPEDQLIFGEGDGRGPGMSEAADIVGHELTHGVTHYTSDLKYQNETGAINEAVSDIFGSAIEAWVRSGGGAAGNPTGGIKPDANTWIVCDRCTQGVQRYMNNPTQDGQSKDYYPDRYQGQNDSGGVHLNSGIMNLAFYLLSEGGVHPRNKTKTQVHGIGFEKALQIYFDANTRLFSAVTNINTGFSDARRLLADAAETRYGKCSAEWQAVNESYDAVGVPGSWQSCSTSTPVPAPAPNPAPVNNGPGTNLALAAKATVSSAYSSAYVASKINDGSMSTKWRSKTIRNRYQQETVLLDFGINTKFGEVVIHWSGNDYARRFYIDVQNNNQWKTVQSVRKTARGDTKIKLSAAGSKLRIRMQEGAYYRWYAINEITVTEGSSVVVAPAPVPLPAPVPVQVPYPLPWPVPITNPIPFPSPVQVPFPVPVQYPVPIRLPSPVQWPVYTPPPVRVVMPTPYPWWKK